MSRSKVPKYIKREPMPTRDESESNKQPMKYDRGNARKRKPFPTNKGRGVQGGYWGK